jgi:predicted permease
MGKLLRRLLYLFRHRRMEAELTEEMEIHREMKRQELSADGPVTPWAVNRQFGNIALAREESRGVWIPLWLDQLRQDTRYSVRMLRRSPGVTLVVVLTLALGIGANTAVFSLIDAQLFRPAPWSNGAPLVWIAASQGRSGRIGNMSYPDYLAYRDEAATLSGIAAYRGTALAIGGFRARRVLGGMVSGNFFDVVGIRAAMGRTLTPNDDQVPGGHPVVVLSDGLWRDHFGADPHVLGSQVSINGTPFTIVGVIPRGFTGVAYGSDAEQLWIPLAMQSVAMPTESKLLQQPDARWLRAVARLQEGATLEQADAEIRTIARHLNAPETPPDRTKGAEVLAVRGGLNVYEQRDLTPVFGLIAMVPALVLLVACANVANVLMARNTARQRELAMRRALGATQGRIIRQHLAESVLLALLGAVAGFVAAFVLIAVIARLGTVPADVVALVQPDTRALAATGVVALLATIVFGLAPAFAGSNHDVLPTLKVEGVTATQARSGAYLSRAFIVAQVAVSLVLLIAAGLILQSFFKALRVDPGFATRDVVIISFDPELQRYTSDRRDSFVAQLLERAAVIPGGASVALTTSLPLSDGAYGARVHAGSATEPVPATFSSVTPGYFETLRVPLLRGRDFSSVDAATAPPVVIVNQSLAQRLWSDEDPIGQRMRLSGDDEPAREVIGVAADIKTDAWTDRPRYGFYLPLQQQPNSPLTLVVRTTAPPRTALSAIEDIVRSLDADLPLFNVQTLEEVLRSEANLRRASASLLGVFGGLAVLLAAIGIYGVTSHSASRRTREVGIRMSLGARSADVCRMFIRESLTLSIIGIVIGLGISTVASQIMVSFLFGLTATDTATFVGAAGIMGLIVALASYVPSRRAARVDPLLALRSE